LTVISYLFVQPVLACFSVTDLVDMREADGAIGVRCEYCATSYRFAPGEFR